MKKTINTKVVTTTILDTTKAKLNWAIFFFRGDAHRLGLWKAMQEAKETLYILETIFFCDDDIATANKINKICKKMSATDLEEARQIAKESYEEIRKLEYEINKSLED